MADGATTLLYRFLGIDEGAGAQFDRMAGKTTMLGKSSDAALAKMKMLGAGVAIAGGVIAVASVDMAAKFQTSMLRLQTQANVSHKNVEILSKGILDMAGSVATTPGALADAAYHIASIGQNSLTTSQELRVLKIATEGAKLGGANLTDVTNALDAAIVSHIKGVKNYSQAMGVLNSTVGAGDMTMQDLAEAFGPLGAVMKGYNVDIKQVGAALATFGDNNIRGAQAGTQLRMAVQALAVPSAAGKKLLESWGLSAGNLSKQLQHGGLTDALDTLMTKMRANGVTAKEQGDILTQAFGKRAGVGLSVLMGELDRYHDKLGEVSKGATGFGSSWSTYTKSFGFALDSAKASAEALMIELGTKLLPVATKLMNWIASTAIPAISRLVGWFEKHKTAAKALGIALAALALYFGGPITAAAVLATGLTVLWNKSNTFRTVVKATAKDAVASWNAMRAAGLAVWAALGKAWDAFANGPLAFVKAQIGQFTSWYDDHAQEIKQATSNVWAAISTIIRANWQAAMVIIKPGLVALEASFKTSFGVARDTVKTFVSVVADLIRTAQKVIEDFVAVVLDVLTGRWSKAWQDAKEAVLQGLSGTARIIQDFGSGLYQTFYDFGQNVVQGLINGIGSLASEAEHAAASVAGKVAGAVKGVLHIGSPSKLMEQYGIWIVEGLVNGIKTYTPKAKDVAKQLALGLISGWQDGTSKLKDALSSPAQKALNGLTSVISKAVTKQQGLLKTAQTNLKSLLSARASDISSLAGNISSGADLSGLFGTDANGNPSTANVGSFLSGQASQIKRFANDLTSAARKGLSPALLSEISGLGAAQGDQVLKQFLTGAASIKSANASEATIQKYSTGAAKTVEDALYAKQMAAANKAVSEQTKATKELTKELDKVARQTAKKVETHLTIDAKTGKPVVDKKFIDDIIKGIKQAERVAGKKLL